MSKQNIRTVAASTRKRRIPPVVSQILCWWLWLLLAGVTTTFAGDGGIVKTLSSKLSGTTVAPLFIGDTASVLLPVVYQQSPYVRKQLKNIVKLSLVEETSTYLPVDFTASVDLKIEYGHTTSSLSEKDITLTVTYNKEQGAKYNAKNYFSFDGWEYVRITIVHVPALVGSFNPAGVLLLEDELRATVYPALSTTATNLVPTFSAAVFADTPTGVRPDEVSVSWTWPTNAGNNGTQLEWAWLEDELRPNYTNADGSFNYALLFKYNASRVDLLLDTNHYRIPLFYDGQGKLYYRVRAVDSRGPAGGRMDAPWSAIDSITFSGHNDSLNWQVTTSYAEEGKRKTVIQYFDGSLRSRQTVTKDNTTNTTITAETFYDKQGRAAIQVLPAPGINTIVAYTRDLNRFNLPGGGTQTAGTDPAEIFDFTTTTSGNYAVPGLSSSSGAAQYYSSSNPEISSDPNAKNLPDAHGFAYTVTRYTPDATGRILRQSGVGDSLAMGSGHETQYFYGGAAVEELDALFGTEVGDYTHYFKNMVQDANGQMSVSYVDMHGRTIATALAGAAPAGMQILNISDTTQYHNQAGSSITRNLLNANTNTLKDNSIEAINTILVPSPTLYDFTYQFPEHALHLPVCAGGTDSFTCKYDLEISITDESGDTPPIIITHTSTDTNVDHEFIHDTITLHAGSYAIRKTLTINQASLQQYLQQYAVPGIGICQSQQAIIDSIEHVMDSVSGCGVTPVVLTCQTCLDSLGSFAVYKHRYATSIGITDTSLLTTAQVADIRTQYVNDSSFCNSLSPNISHQLDIIKQQMLRDMVPYSGQYAQNPDSVVNPALTMYKKYDIFATGGTTSFTQPFYKHPLDTAGHSSYYYTAAGRIDSSLLPSLLPTTPDSVFQHAFVASWANALLPYHPEYKKLVYVQQHLLPVYNWIDSFNLVTTPVADPIHSDPYFTGVGIGDSATMHGYVLVNWKQGLSLWQYAYGNALGCGGIADTANRHSCYTSMPATFVATGTAVSAGSLGTITISAAQQSQAWSLFQPLYTQARTAFVNHYINQHTDTTDNQALVDQGYQVYFPTTPAQQAQQAGWGSWYTSGTIPANLPDSATALGNSYCAAYINSWQQALLQCNAIGTSSHKDSILYKITTRMLAVCQHGTDAANPFGAASVIPGNPAGTDTSFEQVVYSVLAEYGISKSQYCNPYVIVSPKPHGYNPVLTKATTATVDTCNCKLFTAINNQALAAGYNTDLLVNLNAYLLLTYNDTITPALFSAFQHCSELHQQVCPGGDCYDSVIMYSLPGPQPLPSFLTCGFTPVMQCYSCTAIGSLTTQFRTLFAGTPDSIAPVFGVDSLDTVTMGYNALYANFLNYRTGMQHNWLYYEQKLSAAGCTIGLPGDGAGNCAPGTGLDTLLVTSRAGNTPSLYSARTIIRFTPGFHSGPSDSFIAKIDTTLTACVPVSGGNGDGQLCLGNTPLTDTTGLIVITPCQDSHNKAVAAAANVYQAMQQQALANFQAAYLTASVAVGEQFTVTYTNTEYHYTLYYYDQAGNLVKTVPPKGAYPIFRKGYTDSVEQAKLAGTVLVPPHTFYTQYCYNSLNQVNAQHTPDAGTGHFWYDRLGRLAVSQNAKQAPNDQYSYTLYDVIGRIMQVGQLTNSTPLVDSVSKNDAMLQFWHVSVNSSKEQITSTIYDVPYDPLQPMLDAQNLRNRVAYSMFYNHYADSAAGNQASATFYSYDPHGNVDTLLQDYKGISVMASTNRFKRIVYDYDLVSGKVNQVSYQPGQNDAFYHKYQYDAENRITSVETSRDSLVWQQDAQYEYYKHGPLARTVLGQQQVQAERYVYTLQGWIKAVNPGTADSAAYPVARDAYGYALNYYVNDYAGIGVTLPSNGIPSQLGAENKPLFNGNISSMGVNIGQLGNSVLYNYGYDQLNRLVGMDAWQSTNNVWGSLSKTSNYQERVSYDPNGNILTYLRHGTTANSGQLTMDSLSYSYHAGTNQLNHVNDGVSSSNYTEDIDDQPLNNYRYDAIGNMISDSLGSIRNVLWTVYGKIDSIVKGDGTTIKYQYDVAGNRIRKTTLKSSVSVTTVYVRDAQGNVLSVYTDSSGLVQSEIDLYGSSRLGVLKQLTVATTTTVLGIGDTAITSTFTRGEKLFELGNQLGNVLVTLSDKKLQHSTDGSSVDYYNADVATATDFYPFGMMEPGRQYSNGSGYRYGFNGKEKSDEIEGNGVNYDYGSRIYDARVGRFLSVDPFVRNYPGISDYAFAQNSPVYKLDVDGNWDITVHAYSDRSKYGYGVAIVTNKKGKEVFRFKVRLEGMGGRDRMDEDADTPLGTYDIPGGKDTWITGGRRDAYGPNARLDLEGESGEIKESKRSLIRIHGGRQEKAIKDKDGHITGWEAISNAQLQKTNGCLRASDEDVKKLKETTDKLEADDKQEVRGKLKVVADLQFKNGKYIVPTDIKPATPPQTTGNPDKSPGIIDKVKGFFNSLFSSSPSSKPEPPMSEGQIRKELFGDERE